MSWSAPPLRTSFPFPGAASRPRWATWPVSSATATRQGFQSGEYGRKYEVTTPITFVEPGTFGYGVATCNGDSGGPAFVDIAGREYLAGVTSWGDDGCVQFGFNTRLDTFDDWVTARVAELDTPTCAPDGLCADGCGVIDIDCPCAADGLCTAACQDASLDPDCPAACAADGTCAADCPTRDPDCPGVLPGGDCETSAACEAGVCRAGTCAELCTPGQTASCGDATSCVDDDSGVYACGTPAGCGCRVAPRTPSALSWPLAALLAGLFAFALRRRYPGS